MPFKSSARSSTTKTPKDPAHLKGAVLAGRRSELKQLAKIIRSGEAAGDVDLAPVREAARRYPHLRRKLIEAYNRPGVHRGDISALRQFAVDMLQNPETPEIRRTRLKDRQYPSTPSRQMTLRERAIESFVRAPEPYRVGKLINVFTTDPKLEKEPNVGNLRDVFRAGVASMESRRSFKQITTGGGVKDESLAGQILHGVKYKHLLPTRFKSLVNDAANKLEQAGGDIRKLTDRERRVLEKAFMHGRYAIAATALHRADREIGTKYRAMKDFESAYRRRNEPLRVVSQPKSVSETKSAKQLPKGVSLSMIMKAMPKRPKTAPLSKAELPRHLEPLASLSIKDVPTVQNRRLFKPEPETGRHVTRPTYRRKDPLIFEPATQKHVKSSEVLSAIARSKEHRPLLAHPTELAKYFGENWVRQLRQVEPTGEYKSALHPKYGMALRKFVDIKSARAPGVPRVLRYDYISNTVRPMIDVLGYENAAVFAHEHFRHAKQIARKVAKSIFGTLKLKPPQSRKEKRLQRKQLAKHKKMRGELEDMIVDQITRGVRMSFLSRDKAKRGYGVPEYLGLKLDDVIGSRIASNVVGHLAKRRGKRSQRVNLMLDKLQGKVNEAAGMVDEKTGKPKFKSKKEALKHVLSQPENKDIVKTLFPQLGAIVKGIKKSREILQSHLFVAQDKIEEERRAAKEEHLSLKRELDAKAKERAIATGQYVIGKGVKVGDKYKVFRASYFYSPEEKEAYKESRQRLIKAYKKADALTRSMSQIALPVEYKPPTKFTPEHREEESELAEYGKSSMSERRGRRRKPEYQEPAKKKARTRKGKVMYRQTARRQGLV